MSQSPKVLKRVIAGEKLTAERKMTRVPVRFEPTRRDELLRKPAWIRSKLPGTPQVAALKKKLRSNGLNTVCEEASCPNLGECFQAGTATFMIMGAICTRRCPFCDVAHGRPLPLDADEPANLARTIADMALRYVVITSVDRDDLRDGGAGHFAACIEAIRMMAPTVRIEILTPDFRSRVEKALEILKHHPADVFNHNLETVPRLYSIARPGAHYQGSLDLLKAQRNMKPDVPTKSGLMLGLGETLDEVVDVMRDLRQHDVDMITLGQYLQPSLHHLPVIRYLSPAEFDALGNTASELGFKSVASGPMVRSSYHADIQAHSLNS
ncbi:MAG: lipoyl synthase [marine bacterium B5-7]|nr:MAG: lipoyl synthase [marine bacterium B5-7]